MTCGNSRWSTIGASPMLNPQQSAALSQKIQRLLQKPAADGIAARRDRILALIASADDSRHLEEAPAKNSAGGAPVASATADARASRLYIRCSKSCTPFATI